MDGRKSVDGHSETHGYIGRKCLCPPDLTQYDYVCFGPTVAPAGTEEQNGLPTAPQMQEASQFL